MANLNIFSNVVCNILYIYIYLPYLLAFLANAHAKTWTVSWKLFRIDTTVFSIKFQALPGKWLAPTLLKNISLNKLYILEGAVACLFDDLCFGGVRAGNDRKKPLELYIETPGTIHKSYGTKYKTTCKILERHIKLWNCILKTFGNLYVIFGNELGPYLSRI